MRLFRATVLIAFAVCALCSSAGVPAEPSNARSPCGPGVFVPAQRVQEPVLAWFGARSYSPESTATLFVRARASRLTVSLWHVVASDWWIEVAPASNVTLRGPDKRLRVHIGDWPSGLYLASVETGNGTFSAPFILRSHRPGEHSLAVVLPTGRVQPSRRCMAAFLLISDASSIGSPSTI
jgi:hypothetical protein